MPCRRARRISGRVVVATPAATYPVLTRDQYRRLIQHAAALDTTPEEALNTLLGLPLLTPAKHTRPWTAEELALLANPANTPRTLALRTGRTRSAISNKRHKMMKAAAANATT